MERFLDVSELAAPEPLELALSSIESLGRGEYLHMYHRRDPLPLYALLEERGCRWRSGRDAAGMVHLFAWHGDDDDAERDAQAGIARCIRT